MSTPREPQFGLGKSLAFSAILIACFLGVAECGVRCWAYFFREETSRYDPMTQTFVLVPGTHRTPLGRVKINTSGFVGSELAPPGEDLWRIVAVGDSCTFGAGDDVNTYSAMLQQRLQRIQIRGQRYDVVNAGISGLDSTLALRRLESVVPPLEPDVVTLYIGWNDLMKFDPLSQGEASRFSGVARALDELWLAKGLRKLLFYHVRPRLRPPATGPESRTGRFHDFVPGVYEANLHRMIAAVRSMRARPLLMTLPTVVREDMSAADLRRAGVVFPYFPSAYAVGDLLDLLAAYNRTVREVGGAEGVPVLDLARHFEALPDVTGYFYDTMHTNDRGMAIIADALASELQARELLGPPARPHAAASSGAGR